MLAGETDRQRHRLDSPGRNPRQAELIDRPREPHRRGDPDQRTEDAEHDAFADEHRSDTRTPQADRAQGADLGGAFDHRHAHRVGDGEQNDRADQHCDEAEDRGEHRQRLAIKRIQGFVVEHFERLVFQRRLQELVEPALRERNVGRVAQLQRNRRDLRRRGAEDEPLRLREMQADVDIVELLDALELGAQHADGSDVGCAACIRREDFDARASRVWRRFRR